MNVSLHEAKTHLPLLIEVVESGEEVVIMRRQKPVARIVPVSGSRPKRIGLLAKHPFRMGNGFDRPASAEALGDLFGVLQFGAGPSSN